MIFKCFTFGEATYVGIFIKDSYEYLKKYDEKNYKTHQQNIKLNVPFKVFNEQNGTDIFGYVTEKENTLILYVFFCKPVFIELEIDQIKDFSNFKYLEDYLDKYPDDYSDNGLIVDNYLSKLNLKNSANKNNNCIKNNLSEESFSEDDYLDIYNAPNTISSDVNTDKKRVSVISIKKNNRKSNIVFEPNGFWKKTYN